MSSAPPAAAPGHPLPSRCSSCEYAAALPAALLLLLQPLLPASAPPVSLLLVLLPLLR
jgi:hypothetical protein